MCVISFFVGADGCLTSKVASKSTMIFPSSQISKVLFAILILILMFYVYMDVNLYFRIQDYPIDRGTGENYTLSYADVSWFGCDISPLCDVTVKALLLDHTNHYIFAPLVTIADRLIKISDVEWITPNSISFFHVLVAITSAKCISTDSLTYRRIGVLLFQLRTFLDDMDGHVARARKNIKGERSEIGTSGYYIDGLCDAMGCVALLIGIFVFLKNNPPRRGYMQLPVLTNETKERCESNIVYKARNVAQKVGCFTLQLLISSAAWNRYIAIYQDVLETNDVSRSEFLRQNIVFRSSFFFCVAWFWRIVNVHNMIHCLLLSVFCDKLWEFLKAVQYVGFGVLLSVICVTEMHILDVKKFIFKRFTENHTRY